MICYKDKTFCAADCMTLDCHRQFTPAEAEQARAWWGGDNPPVAFADFSLGCPDYQAAAPRRMPSNKEM